MAKYKVEITETLQYQEEIEAKSEEEAGKVYSQSQSGSITLKEGEKITITINYYGDYIKPVQPSQSDKTNQSEQQTQSPDQSTEKPKDPAHPGNN